MVCFALVPPSLVVGNATLVVRLSRRHLRSLRRHFLRQLLLRSLLDPLDLLLSLFVLACLRPNTVRIGACQVIFVALEVLVQRCIYFLMLDFYLSGL